MKRIILFLFVGISFFVLGQDKVEIKESKDISLQDATLSVNYLRGAFLIYDCKSLHWVCTGEIEYNRCKKQREKSLLDNELSLGCAPIREFKTEKSCINTQKSMIDRGSLSQFCKGSFKR